MKPLGVVYFIGIPLLPLWPSSSSSMPAARDRTANSKYDSSISLPAMLGKLHFHISLGLKMKNFPFQEGGAGFPFQYLWN